MKRRFLSILVLSFICTFFAFGQEDDDSWFWNKVITKVEFEGLKNVRKSDLSGITNDCVDQLFTEEVYLDLVDRLYSLDIFDDIEPYAKHSPKNPDNVVLVIKVTESPVITKISFEGNHKIRNSELRDVVKNKISDVYVESKILLDERLLRDHYLEKGYSDSKVNHKTVKTDSGIEVVFVVAEGHNTVITEITTLGNTIVSERVLKNKLQLKEVGFLKDGAFQNTTLEVDKRNIVMYYQERGYVDAAVQDVVIHTEYNPEKDRNEMSIQFIISEGSQYTFSGLKISGNEVFRTEELASKMKLKEGQIFNYVKFEEGLSEITGLYYENGYMSNDFRPVPIKDSETKTIGYDLTIRENTRSRIENILIKGNTKTKDYVIRREIPLETGDVFSRDKIINGMRNLYNLQYFSNILPDVQSGSEANLVDLVFAVEEQSTTNLNFGMTFSGVTDPNEWPISLYLKIENSNLFGEGKNISAALTVSNVEQSLDFSYGQNWIGDLPISFSQSLAFSHQHSYAKNNMFLPNMSLDQYYYYMNYNSWSASLGSAIGRRWTPDFAILSLAGGITDSLTNYKYDENLYTPTDLGIALFSNRWGLLNSIWSSFSVDARDINFDPTSGWFMSEKLAWNGLMPWFEREFFLRSDTILEGYLKLFDKPIKDDYRLKGVLAATTSFSGLFPIPSTTISESNRIYIDGIINGRGWSELYKSSISKGQAMWSTKLEFRMPVVPNIVGVDIFHDIVVVKPTVGQMFTDLHMNDFYFSFGPGARILLQQLPLHLCLAFRYRIQDGGFKWDSTPFQFTLSYNIVNK